MIYNRLMLFQSKLYDMFVGDYYKFPKVGTALVNSVIENGNGIGTGDGNRHGIGNGKKMDMEIEMD